MEFNHLVEGQVCVVMPRGRIDNTTAAAFEKYLQGRVQEGFVRLVLDLTDVEYMSSAGLRTLVSVLKVLKQRDGDLRLSNLSPRVNEVMRLAGLSTIFQIHPEQAVAVASYG